MRYDSLPSEFQGLSGKVNYVRRVSAFEWSSSCPQCGGEVHKGGGSPDRFRMWTNAHGVNKIFGWCRKCSYFWTPNKEQRLSPAEFEQWRQEQIAVEQERKAAAERAIALLQSEHLWEHYQAGMTDFSRAVIEGWGIRGKWAGYWKLGFNPDLVVFGKEGEYHNPAISIPVWQKNGTVANIKFRTLNPKDSNDRYRMAYKTGFTFLFWAFRNVDLKNCLVVEGEKKAMVCAQNLYEAGVKMQVVGLPSVSPTAELLHELDSFENVILCLDPDARKEQNGFMPQKRAIDILGRHRTKVIDYTEKIDDAIVQHGLHIEDLVKYAR